MAYLQSYWFRVLFMSLLCVTARAITINNNLTVVLEELTDEEDRTISVPEVETLILRCGQTGNQQVRWTWSEGDLNSTCFNITDEGQPSLSLNCVNQNYSGTYSCAYDSTNISVTVTVSPELETLFVGEDLQYLGPNVHMAIPLGPRDRRGEEVVIPCVPVGRTPAGDYNAEWMFSTERGNFETVITAGPHPRDGAAGVSFGNVAGTNGSITKGLLRIGSLFPSVAGYYLCTLSSGMTEVANNTALLYYGPVFDRFSFRNASVIEGHVAELICEAFAFPVPEFKWERCMNQGDSCYSSCTTPEMISFNDSKYDSWRPTPPLALYGIQDVLQVRDAVYDSPGSDRGCYRCRITHEGSSAERLIFLRVRDNLAVLWPILGIVCEALIVAVFILGGTIYTKWRQSRQSRLVPTRSVSGSSENRNLLASTGDAPVNADGPRKRADSSTAASSSV